ncbi:hypothetical protein FHG87_011490 [Trinorchestia longiramus]|nr:hypothetical protein FHG87_011490 [Trinorchestia longiramus]
MWELVSALYMHGANVDKLSTLLPHWEKSDIASILRRFEGKARRERHIIEKGRKAFLSLSSRKFAMKVEENVNKPGASESSGSTDAALVTWLELLQRVHALEGTTDKMSFGNRVAKSAPIKDHSQLLSKTLLYASSMEDHFQGGSIDEASYSEIYRYLSQLLDGEAPTQLRPKSAAKILEMVDRLTAAISSGAFKEAIAVLRQQDFSHIEEFQVKPVKDEIVPSSAAKYSTSDGLFEEATDSAPAAATSSLKEEIEALDVEHPYFQEHRNKVNAKLNGIQSSAASCVGNVPGINPLHLPPCVMTKPLTAFGSTYPCRSLP